MREKRFGKERGQNESIRFTQTSSLLIENYRKIIYTLSEQTILSCITEDTRHGWKADISLPYP